MIENLCGHHVGMYVPMHLRVGVYGNQRLYGSEEEIK